MVVEVEDSREGVRLAGDEVGVAGRVAVVVGVLAVSRESTVGDVVDGFGVVQGGGDLTRLVDHPQQVEGGVSVPIVVHDEVGGGVRAIGDAALLHTQPDAVL